MQAELDFTGAQLRDAGIDRAKQTADSKQPKWSETIYEGFKRYLLFIGIGNTFMIENFREWAEQNGYDMPENKRAFGFITPKACKQGFIRFVGTGKVKNKAAHCANAGEWLVLSGTK